MSTRTMEAGIRPRALAPVFTGQSEQQIQMPSQCLALPLLRSSRHFDHSSDLLPESPAECPEQGSRQTQTSAPATEAGRTCQAWMEVMLPVGELCKSTLSMGGSWTLIRGPTPEDDKGWV